MALDFDMGLMNWLADHRPPWLTPIVQAASDLGEIQGFILVSLLIYVMFDKALAIRLSLLVALTMCLNHMAKILIQNPRPFIEEGNYLAKWAIPTDGAQDLAREYSTPSGHAMAGASFYSYLFASVRSRPVRTLCVAAILVTGLSRPYLGVHYAEDILLGWAVGLAVGLLAWRFGGRFGAWWNTYPLLWRIAAAVIASAGLWTITIAINGWQIDGQPRAFLGYAGTVTGIVIARPLELRWVGFDPKSAPVAFKLLRYALTVGLAFATLAGLKTVFGAVAEDYSLTGYALQYTRYIAVSVVGILVAPWLFTKLGLARRMDNMPPLPSH